MELLAPILFALGTWWLSTVLLMWRSKRAEPGCLKTMAVMTLFAGAGLALIVVSRDGTDATSAYLAFVGGLALWAWHEMSYFLAVVTGPRPRACPEGVSASERFVLGVQASLWHELAIVATALGLIALTWGSPNPFGAWTFAVLWIMRWSSKLNIFFGVRNLHEEFWPDHLRYLGSYVHSASMNGFFPLSMIGAGAALAWMIGQAGAAGSLAVDRTGWILVGTLLALAMLEHVLMFLRVPDAVLWRFATAGTSADPQPKLAVKLTSNQGS
ncbi:MAG: putative photosynthetic complex assembly protein PuhE [Xanthomonadales bacterium]|nr:putative photosynthetic complex assembly protein PuhE [Xanthomonadales bacterium]